MSYAGCTRRMMHRTTAGRFRWQQRSSTLQVPYSAVRFHAWQQTASTRRGVIKCSALEDNVNNAKYNTTSSSKDNPALKVQRRWLRRKKVLRTEPDPADNDILELNVDGRQIITHRSTLILVKGSRLAEMFKKGSESKLMRDGDGKIFLDFNSTAFQIILKYLRELKISNGAYVPLPDVRPEDRSSFRALVAYLQLDIPCWQPDTSADEQMLSELNDLSQYISHPEASQKLASLQSALAAKLREAGSTSPALQASSHISASQQQDASQASSQRATPPTSSSQASTTTGAAKLLNSTSASASGELVLKKPQPSHQGTLPLIDRSVHSSQLYYITTRRDRHNGISLSICTEDEFKAAQSSTTANTAATSSTSRLDILCDATWSDSRLTFTVVCKKQFRNMHLGATSRNQLRRRGMHIPHYGWKQFGHTYNMPAPSSTVPSTRRKLQAPALDLTSELPSLWRKGDCIEMIIDLKHKNRLTLKVNGEEVDHYKELPSHRNWCWYMALSAQESDRNMSCVVFDKDCYDVYWGDYRVSRFRD